MREPDMVAVEADGGDDVCVVFAACQDPRVRKSRAIARQPAAQRDAIADHGTEAGDEGAAVDVQAVRQDEYPRQPVGRELLAKRGTGRKRQVG
jgi:hypothetical protein